MRVTITHITAAYHWLMTTMDGRALAGLERRGTLGTCPTRIRQLGYFRLEDYEVNGVETELLTTDSSACPARGRFVYHTSQKDYPNGAFLVVDAGIQIVSPELSAWQMAKVLPQGEVTKYVNALCGKHSFTRGADGRLVKRAVPLTTIRRLEAFGRQMGSVKHNPAYFRALKYAVEGSESPMESCISILLCLKRQYGGFHLRKPIMGHVVELDEIGRALVGQDFCRCDMYWEGAHYDLEYDSDQEHGEGSATHDSLRRSAIRHMGIEVEELRTPQVVDAQKFEMSAHLIAGKLGQEIHKRSPELEFRYSEAYLDLRKQLFWWERLGSSMEKSPLRVGELDW